MFRKILPQNDSFFDLFEKHAALVCEAAACLSQITHSNMFDLEKSAYVLELEHQCDVILHQTIDLLRRSFITPFEREEIRKLICTMDDIMDFIEGTANRLSLFELEILPEELKQASDVLVQTVEKVKILVSQLRHLKKDNSLVDLLKEIHRLENEGDRLHRIGLAVLFKNETNPIRVIKLKEINEKIEQAIDRCEDVANLVEGIVIEHQG
ncbi:DUF47 domain-containing protein [bacterium]|nr:DUF47 domain-containing protein [bacterium]